MTISEAVTKRLLELCGERGLTINKLCTLSGVTQSTVSDIVNRNTSKPFSCVRYKHERSSLQTA